MCVGLIVGVGGKYGTGNGVLRDEGSVLLLLVMVNLCDPASLLFVVKSLLLND